MPIPLFALLLACDSDESNNSGISRAEFTEAISALQAELDSAGAEIEALESALTQAQQTANANREDLSGLQNDIDIANSAAADNASQLNALDERIFTIEDDYLTSADTLSLPADLIALNGYLSINSSTDTITLSGANLYLNNGLGSTDSTNGLGNLVIGYAEADGSEDRTGSHSLALGVYNSWPEYGSLVNGYGNTPGTHGAILGGSDNSSSYAYSVIFSGYGNTTNNNYTAIIGGVLNTAGGSYSTIVGGYQNKALNNYTAVVGGQSNTAQEQYSAIVGGQSNTTSGDHAVVVGGSSNESSGDDTVIVGGYAAVADANYAITLGGYQNTAIGAFSSVIGGLKNTASGSYTTQVGGYRQTCSSSYDSCLE